MNLKKKFGKIFDVLLSTEKRDEIINILNIMYKKKYLSLEIILNLIKAFILVIYIDTNNYDIYIQYFDHILNIMNDVDRDYILYKINSLELENQKYLSDKVIENIIIETHNLLKLDTNKNDLLLLLIEIIKYTNQIKYSLEYKVNIYTQFIKECINYYNTNKNINMDIHINYMKNIIKMVNNY